MCRVCYKNPCDRLDHSFTTNRIEQGLWNKLYFEINQFSSFLFAGCAIIFAQITDTFYIYQLGKDYGTCCRNVSHRNSKRKAKDVTSLKKKLSYSSVQFTMFSSLCLFSHLLCSQHGCLMHAISKKNKNF